MRYRNTLAHINLNNLSSNVKNVIRKYYGYKYYIGVVKADCYGHNGYKVIDTIIKSGCNYLAVSSLEEGIVIRKKFDIPILCLGIIDSKYIDIAIKNNIDITVTNIEYLRKIKDKNATIHLKVDTGMNRLGIKSKVEFDSIINELKTSNLSLKGVYTHIYEASNSVNYKNQVERFQNIVGENIDKIEMVHIAQSETLTNYPKISFANGCRLGIIMYGLLRDSNLLNTFSLTSEVIEIRKISSGETVGYNGNFKAKKDTFIATVSIGYADGVNRHIVGAYIYINNKKYKVVSICMDMLMVEVDDCVKLKDIVYIYKDNDHIFYLSDYMNTIPYELICDISKRVPRKYI